MAFRFIWKPINGVGEVAGVAEKIALKRMASLRKVEALA